MPNRELSAYSIDKAKLIIHFLLYFFDIKDILTYFVFQLNKMPKGTVKFFNNSKGFGFIKPSDGGEDVFVHVSALAEEIRENDQVSYEVEMGKKGKNAVKVKVID